MRASDGDRERVVQALQEQVGEGRLTLEEFEERSGAVYEAKTVGDLRKLTSDLPVDLFPRAPQSPFGAGSPWPQPFPMPAVPPWQQRQVVHRAGRPNPIIFVVLAFLAFALVGDVLVASASFIVPLVVIGFIVLRLAARGGGRRYPPYR
ncbi:MAG TPA: DUF1707 domain-containing protein [Pseudonocardiaceae bacterium]|nr:DUF1707 domain-containing protein [Pseudonocardiaceae bacterium]